MQKNPSLSISVSSIFLQTYNSPFNINIIEANKALRRYCLTHGYDFISHGNIAFKHLLPDGMHLSPEGYCLLAKNILEHLGRGEANFGLGASFPPNTAGQDMVAPGWSHQHLGFKKGLVIASLNVNGLRSHLDEVQLLLNNLGIHILSLNETKLDGSVAKELTDMVGYQQKRLDRNCNGGGISIYIRDSIRYKPRDDVPVDDLEHICIEIEPPNCKPFLILVWYRRPTSPVGTFEKLEKILTFFDKVDKEIIFLRDTNCDLTTK